MTFAELLDQIVKPMFPGLKITRANAPLRDHMALVAPKGVIMRVRESVMSFDYFQLQWSHEFHESDIRLIEQAIVAYGRLQREAPTLVDSLHERIQRSAIATALTRSEDQRVAVERVILAFTDWSSQTYEGERVSAAVTISAAAAEKAQPMAMQSVLEEDFSKTLTDGTSSWWEVDVRSQLVDLAIERHSFQFGDDGFFPFRYLALSQASDGEIAVGLALNRHGEVLVFAEGALRFARRRGRWIHFTHAASVKQMAGGPGARPHALRRAIYESCLDASFARSGACIGLVLKSKFEELQKVVAPEDRLKSPINQKARVAAGIIRGRKFVDLPRLLRKQLLRMDGALIVLWDGTIYACGALVDIGQVERGNHGGRSAAAKSLSRFGLGVKVSEDGLITAYKDQQKCFEIG